jgi:hypothetical protein
LIVGAFPRLGSTNNRDLSANRTVSVERERAQPGLTESGQGVNDEIAVGIGRDAGCLGGGGCF